MRLRHAIRRLQLPPPQTRSLAAAAALALLAFIAICGTVLLDARRAAARHAGEMASQLAVAVAQDVTHSLDTYDVALQAIAGTLNAPAWRELAPPLRNQVLFAGIAGLHDLSFVEVLDADGNGIASTPPATHANNWAGRDYFVAQRQNAAVGLYVSRPFGTAREETAGIALSRRVADTDGNFAGVIVAGLHLTHFRELFSRLSLTPGSTVTLLREDGVMLMRLPYDRNDIGRIADDASPYGVHLRTGAAELTAVGPDGQVDHGFAFRRVGTTPLVVGVGLVADSAAGWWLAWLTAAALALSAVTALLLRRLWQELQRRENAERDSEGKSRLLASLSHELRTPLHGIIGYAEQLAAGTRLDPTQSHHVAAIAAAGQHMRSVVDWALDYAWIEARGPALHMAEIDLLDLVEECCATIEPSATARGLRLRTAVKPGVPRRFVTDGTNLRPILLNLLDNAVKFTSEGGVEVRLDLADGRLVLEVADTGIGIPDDQRHKLFHEYERLGAERSAVEGTGLGLATAARLVRRMGGDIGYRANPGGGSIFWITLPAGKTEMPTRQSDHCADAMAQVDSLRVLVVDDSAIGRDVAAAFLRDQGHQVLLANDGAEAVRIVAEQDVDVVLMDMRMAGIDGLAATRQIRALAAPRRRVPIIAMTANALDRHVAECLRAGMAAHLPKPFSSKELAAVLARVMSEQRRFGLRSQATIDVAVLDQLAGCLSADALCDHLLGLSDRIELFLHTLDEPDALAAPASLGEMAHALTGSAGTLGLTRLSAAAQELQHVLETDPAQARQALNTVRREATAALEALRVRLATGHAVAA